MPKLIDLTGRRFGRYLVESRNERRTKMDSYWNCVCDCGERRVVGGKDLRDGGSKSCGCLQAEIASTVNTKHGFSNAPIRHVWRQMMERCYDAGNKSFAHYGGRGIKVCERWHDMVTFARDMGAKPGPGYSLDRIDNDGDYTPENCRWATATQQVRNRRNTVRIEGLAVGELCERFGVPYKKVRGPVYSGRITTIAGFAAYPWGR